jgi:hypothetical protein
VFLLQTEAARAKQAATLPSPYLPTGTVIGGLLAAMLSYCQVGTLSRGLLQTSGHCGLLLLSCCCRDVSMACICIDAGSCGI